MPMLLITRCWQPAIALLLLCFSLILTIPSPVSAQDQSAVDVQIAHLATATAEVRAVEQAAETANTGKARRELIARLATAKSAAGDTSTLLQEQMALVDARLTELGTPTDGIVEAPDIMAERKALARRRATIDAAIKRSNLLGTEAQQMADAIAAEQAAELSKSWATRAPSPLTPTFWIDVIEAVPQDLKRVKAFGGQVADGVRRGMRSGTPWLALAGLVGAFLLAGPARAYLRKVGRRHAIEAVPGHRVRRSGYSIWRLLIGTALPTLAAFALVTGLRWSGLIAPGADIVVDAIVRAVGFGAFTAALASTLVMRSEPSWRLLPISDDMAQALLPWGWIMAAFVAIDPLLLAFNKAVRASEAAMLCTNMIEAAARIVVVIGVLLVLSRMRTHVDEAEASDGTPEGSAHIGSGLVSLAIWMITIVGSGALLLGYVNFSLFLTGVGIMWATIVIGTVYLLTMFADDVATTTFSRTSPVGHMLVRGIGIRPSTVDQFGVLLSGLLRIALALLALTMLFAPFGSGVTSRLSEFDDLAQGITVGGVTLSPWSILRSVMILVIGLALSRLFMRWLNDRYLPKTEMGQSARNSMAMIARYVTVLLAALWGLASLGIGMERIALLLSALSVGIGFGLQAITQNFVSGLILLAERPVKIGDLIKIGNEEGDVKRINVRSTEIELGDHSTLIVPNSELITKSVLNKTLGNPLGRVQIQFSVPLGVEPDRVRKIVMEGFAGQPAILEDPRPVVFLDNIVDGRILFNCIAHTSSPRTTYDARSTVLGTILQQFAEKDIDIGTVPQRFEMASSDTRLKAGRGTDDAVPPGLVK